MTVCFRISSDFIGVQYIFFFWKTICTLKCGGSNSDKKKTPNYARQFQVLLFNFNSRLNMSVLKLSKIFTLSMGYSFLYLVNDEKSSLCHSNYTREWFILAKKFSSHKISEETDRDRHSLKERNETQNWNKWKVTKSLWIKKKPASITNSAVYALWRIKMVSIVDDNWHTKKNEQKSTHNKMLIEHFDFTFA